MGAIASGGTIVLNEDVLRSARVSAAKLEAVIDREKAELARREALYRQGPPAPPIDGRAVVLVDDGLATGASMRAAIRAVAGRARRMIVAVPVGARTTCEELRSMVDGLVCALIPEPLDAVSLFYREFQPTSDEEVQELLRRGAQGVTPIRTSPSVS
jgi:putative phosphoribosyl transferase